MFLERVVVLRSKLELKYCECCGALWLRKQGSEGVTCGACEAMWADLPNVWIRGLKKKPVTNHREISASMQSLKSWAAQAEGGRA